jgi:hypothetical protein
VNAALLTAPPSMPPSTVDQPVRGDPELRLLDTADVAPTVLEGRAAGGLQGPRSAPPGAGLLDPRPVRLRCSAEADGNRTRLSRATAHTGFEDLNSSANVSSGRNAAGQGMSRPKIIENLAVLSNGSNGDSVPVTVPAAEPHHRSSA